MASLQNPELAATDMSEEHNWEADEPEEVNEPDPSIPSNPASAANVDINTIHERLQHIAQALQTLPTVQDVHILNDRGLRAEKHLENHRQRLQTQGVLLFGLFLMMILLLGLLGFLVWKQMRHVQSVQHDMVAMTRDVSDWKSNVMAALEKVNQPPPTDDLSTIPEESEDVESEDVVRSSASSVVDAGPQNMPDLAAMLPGYRRRADAGASNNQSQATAHTMNQSLGEKFSKLFLQQPVVMSR
jgi:hypothetical protein